MPKQKPKPPSKKNFLYMTPGSKQTAAQTSAVKKAASPAAAKKAAAIAASKARGDAVRAAGGSPTAPKYPTKAAAIAASKNRGERAVAAEKGGRAKALKDRAFKEAASDRARANTIRKTPRQVKAVKQEKLLQDVANRRATFTPTEADPMGWKSIAAALADAGDARFAKYKTGRRGSSAANAYVAGNKSKNKGPS